MIYELRTYTCLPGKRDAVVALHGRVLPMYTRNNIKIIGFWTTLIGRAETFYYMLEYESLADRDAKRAKFFQDPEVQKLMQEVAAEPALQFQDNTILQPTAYSPLRQLKKHTLVIPDADESHFRRDRRNCLQLTLKKCRGILDTLDTTYLADDYPGQLEEVLGIGYRYCVPLSEHEVYLQDSGNGTNQGQSIGF